MKKISFFLILTFFYFNSCIERSRDNPLDPKSKENPKLNLSVLSYNDRIELSWNRINLTDFFGFNVYRKNHPDSSFILIAEGINQDSTGFTDVNFRYNNTYSYYITLQGESNESSPSNIVSITPGRGYNWIVDRRGYQIYKTTYDAQYAMARYSTDWRPQDIAIDPDRHIALITQPTGHRIDLIETVNANLITTIGDNIHSFIDNPYLAEFDARNRMFWVSDSGGSVFRVSTSDYSVHLSISDIIKPDELFIHHNEGIVYIVDDLSTYLYRFDLNGNYVSKFSQIGGYNFRNPRKIIFDSVDNQFWFIDNFDDKDYLYTGYLDNIQIALVDTFIHIFEIHLNPNDQSAWISVFQDNKFKVLQLSKAGIRLSELTEDPEYYYPYHVTHNPYDGTLLVTDSGNKRIIHYDEDFDKLGIFTNLNFPIRLEVE